MKPESAVQHLERAWILVAADPGQADETAESIYKLNSELEDPSAVIRADVVSGTYNVVVPVYAEDEGLIDEIVSMIAEVEGVEAAEKLAVTGYHPYPPHLATGYISGEEAEEGNPVLPGILGMNGWG
jgi:hypothetical protein